MADDTNTDASPIDLPPGEGGHMNYGGTDEAYDGMADKNEGDAADAANRVDRTDMDGLDEDPPRPDIREPEGSGIPRPAPGDNSNV